MSQILEHAKPQKKLAKSIIAQERQKFLGFCVICRAPKAVDVTCSKCNQPLVLSCVGHNHKSWNPLHKNCQ